MTNFDSIATKGSWLQKIGYGFVAMLLFALTPSLSSAQGGADCGTAEVVAPGAYSYGAISGTGASGICFTSATGARWYAFTPGSNGSMDVKACGGIDTRLSIYTGGCGTLTCLASSDDDGDTGCQVNGFASSVLGQSVTAGTTYYIEWDDRWSAAGSSWDLTFTPGGGGGGGETCATAEVLAAPGAYTFPALTGTGASNNCFTGATAAYWYEWTPAGDGTVDIFSCGTVDARVSVYTGACGGQTCIASNDDYGALPAPGCSGSTLTSFLDDLSVTGGTTYYIEWDDRWSSASAGWELVFTAVPTGEDCAAALPVTPGSYTADPLVGTGASNICQIGATAAQWYSWTAPGPGEINVYSCDDGFDPDTRLSVYSGSCGTLACEDFNDDDDTQGCQAPGGFQSTVSGLEVSGGTTYYFEWDDRWSSAGFDWTFEFLPFVPGDDCVYSSSPASFITTGSPVSDIINVAVGAELITDLNVFIDITHTFSGDLDISLTSPEGTVLDLVQDICGADDNMFIEFDDEGGTAYGTCPSTGTFMVPLNALSAFDGENIDGNWTLTVVDDAGGDDGTLNSWCLIPTTVIPACTAPTLTFNQSNTDCTAETFDWSLDIAADGDAADYDVYIQGPPGPATSSCCVNNGTPGCDDGACQATVCGIDGFCCSTEWDGICAGLAEDNCGSLCDPVPGALTFIGTFAGGTTGISLGNFNFGTSLSIVVEHNGDANCNQTEPVVNTEVCGCIDPAAVNTTPGATVDDGSCVYPPANDVCASAQSIGTATYPSTSNSLGNLQGAGDENGLPSCGFTADSFFDVYYEFTVTQENHIIVNVNPLSGSGPLAVEVLDACGGTVIACESSAAGAGPFCDVDQGSAGFPSDAACEASVCATDGFCCSTEWDSICAGLAVDDPNCTECLSPSPDGEINMLLENLASGTYTIRVGANGTAINLSNQFFLINVQQFPYANVQSNPAATLYGCNTTDRQLEDFVGAEPQTGQYAGILDYRWLVGEVGGGDSFEWQRFQANYATRLDWLEMEYGSTYNVFVQMLINHPTFGPVWTVYDGDYTNPNQVGASSCTIATSGSVTFTEVLPAYQGTNVDGDPYELCDFVVASNVLGADNFRWIFSPDVIPGNGDDIVYTRGSGNPSVRLSWVNGLQPGVPYNVFVEARVSGLWSGYVTSHSITLAGVPNVAVRSSYCGGTYAPNGYLLAESVCEADFYRFKFTPQFAGATREKASGSYVLGMGTINPPLDPGTYNVQVQVRQNGVLGDYSPSLVGDACEITISGPTLPGDEAPVAQRSETFGNATLFPNPNAGSEVRMELDGLSDGNHEVMIQIYDVYGKLIQTDGFGHEGNRLSRLVRFENELAMGMYMVQIVVDGDRFATERLIVK